MLLSVCSLMWPQKNIEIIAHRGYWDIAGAARNSVAALKNAISQRYDGTEFDIQVTKDEIPMIHHDAKTSNGILIGNMNYKVLMDSAAKLENGEKIPTLATYLKTWKRARHHQTTRLVLEIKSCPTSQAESNAVRLVLKEVAKHNIPDSCIEYIAFSRFVCKELKRECPRAIVSYLRADQTPAEVKNAGLDGIDYDYRALLKHPQWVEEAHSLGLIVNAWTVDDEEDMKMVIALGVDKITTNNPVALRRLLSE